MKLVFPWILTVVSPVCSAIKEGNASGPIVDSVHETFNPSHTQDRRRFLQTTFRNSCDSLTDESQCCVGSANVCDDAGMNGQFEVDTGSCRGNSACIRAGKNGSAKIGKGSCTDPVSTNPSVSCQTVGEEGGSMTIGEGSCAGVHSCSGGGGDNGNFTIGNRSCIGQYTCYNSARDFANVVFGDDTCHGNSACSNIIKNKGTIVVESGSCHGAYSCGVIGISHNDVYGVSTIRISKNACHGVNACYAQGAYGGSAYIGENSCLNQDGDTDGCFNRNPLPGHFEVGKGSCLNGNRVCVIDKKERKSYHYIIGDNSCFRKEACGFLSRPDKVLIGSGSCQCENCCSCLDGTKNVPDGTCNSLGSRVENCCINKSTPNPSFDDSGKLTFPNATATTLSPTSLPTVIPSSVPSSVPTTKPSSASSSPPSTLLETLKAYTIILQKASFDSTQFILTTNHTTSDVSDENQVQMTIMSHGCNATYGGKGTGKSVMEESPVVSINTTTLVGTALSTTFQVDRFALENSKLTSGINNSDKSTAGKLQFCLKAEVVIGSISLNFRESNIELDYDLSSNSFSITENQIEKESIVTSTESAANIYSIQACRCGTTSFECLSEDEKSQTLNQNSVVNICVQPNSTDVKISHLSMSFLHDGLSQVKFETVTNSTGVPGQSIIRGSGIMANPFKVTSRLISGLFDNGATQFKIEGVAYLQFYSSVRHLNLRADDRILQQEEADPGNVSYQMSVDITSRNMLESDDNLAAFHAPVIVGCLVLVFSIAIIIYKKTS